MNYPYRFNHGLVKGVLFTFVCDRGDPCIDGPHISPGLLFKFGTVLSGPYEEDYGGGGLFEVFVEGSILHTYGDFMEII